MNPRENVWRTSQVKGVTMRTLSRPWQGFSNEALSKEWQAMQAELRQREENRRETSRYDGMMAQYLAEFSR